MTWVFKQTEPELWTVGHYYESRDGQKWEPDTDHGSPEEAAARVHYLNGGRSPDETLVTRQMRALADRVRSMCADFDGALAEHEQGLIANRASVIHLAGKLSDLAGDLARLVNPNP